MTLKSIKYAGINRATPQSDSPNGSCQEIINMRYRKGAWRPIPKKVVKRSSAFTFEGNAISFDHIYLHDIENGIEPGEPNWIGYKLNPAVDATPAYGELYLIATDNTCSLILGDILVQTVPVNVVFLKRTMIVTTDAGVLVFLFTPEKVYVQTSSLPVPTVILEKWAWDLTSVTESVFKAVETPEAILGNYFSVIDTENKDAGLLFGSILYVCVYKLFDGSYILPSVPQHFEISNDGSIHMRNGLGTRNYSTWMEFTMHSLTAVINNDLYGSEFEPLKDIVQSVCLFATKATTKYRIDEVTISDTTIIYPGGDGNITVKQFSEFFPISQDFKDLSKSVSFYKIHEFDFEDLVTKTGRSIVNLDTKDFYQDYATREALTTDQYTHHKLAAKSSYIYNDRLHLLNIRTSIGLPYVLWPEYEYLSVSFSVPIKVKYATTPGMIAVYLKTSLGQAIQSYQCDIPIYRVGYSSTKSFGSGYTLAFATAYLEALESFTSFEGNPVVTTYCPGSGFLECINEAALTYVVRFKQWTSTTNYYILPSIIGYNDSRAYKFQVSVGGKILFDGKLEKNESLNYSLWANTNLADKEFLTSAVIINQTLPDAVSLPFDTNRLQVSEIQNPLIFPAKNSYQVGTGDGITMCAGSEPLSTGQFGQFPLQVFTTKGVWALEIGTGEVLYTNVLPSSSEVIENAMNVISLGNGVVYSTVKGLFILSGRQSTEIGEVCEGIPFDPITTDNDDILKMISSSDNPHFTPGLSSALSQIDFLEYLQGSQIGYDHFNKELCVTNPDYSYSYIFSFESKLWFKISQSFELLINNYPELLGLNAISVVSLSNEVVNNEHIEILMISNAQSIDLPNIFKKLQRTIQRTVFTSNTGKILGFYIMASDDLRTWQTLTGKQREGTHVKDLLCIDLHKSSKYYCFVLNGTVSANSEINDIELIVKEKLLNQLR